MIWRKKNHAYIYVTVILYNTEIDLIPDRPGNWYNLFSLLACSFSIYTKIRIVKMRGKNFFVVQLLRLIAIQSLIITAINR